MRGKYYNSIHSCPVSIWQDVTKTGDLSKLHLGGWYRASKAARAWATLYNEYLAEFGLPEAYKTYLHEMGRAAWEYGKAVNGEPWLMPIAQIREAQARGQIAGLSPSKFSKVLADVSKGMGFQIDPEKTTVAQFFGYVKALQG